MEWKRKWFDRHQNRPFSFQKEQRQTNVQMDQKRISQGASGGRGVCGASPLGSSRRSKSEAPGSADAPSQHAPCRFPESRIPNPECGPSRRGAEAPAVPSAGSQGLCPPEGSGQRLRAPWMRREGLWADAGLVAPLRSLAAVPCATSEKEMQILRSISASALLPCGAG